MPGSLLPEPKQQFLNDIGDPLFGGQLFTYSAGTLTPKATYQDQALTILNTNPVIANSRGEVVMYGSGSYRVILKDFFGNTIYDRDNIETPDVIANSLVESLASSAGSSLIGYTVGTTGAITRTVQSKLREFISVMDFIPVGTVTSTTNCIPFIQLAVNYLDSVGGGTLYFPRGSYYFGAVNTPIVNASRLLDGVTLKSNITFLGDGAASIIKIDGNCCTAFMGRFTAEIIDPALNMKNIAFIGLKFTRPATTFFQEQLTLNIESCENVLIKDCQFIGWSGDAIMLGDIINASLSAFLQGIIKNVRITGCLFDGVDKNNRQAISIFTGENIEIDNNVFMNTTRTDMPGAIDIEPELTTAVIKNIRIHSNTLINIGGMAGVIGFAITPNMTQRAENIAVYDNQISKYTNTYALAGTGKPSADPTSVASGSPANISFERNKVSGDGVAGSFQLAFGFRGIDGLVVADNTFSDTRGSALFALPGGGQFYPVRGVSFNGNKFSYCKVVNADPSKSLISFVGNVFGGKFSGNEFYNSGVWANESTPTNMHIFGFETASNVSAYLDFSNNTFNTGGAAYSTTDAPYYSPIPLTNSSVISLRDSIYIGIAPLDASPSMYSQCPADVVNGTWAPALSGFTITGSPTISGKYTKQGRLVTFMISITGATSTTNVAATGVVTNMPYTIGGISSGICTVTDLTTFVGSTTGYLPAGSTQCYPPAWTATSNGKVISGSYLTN